MENNDFNFPQDIYAKHLSVINGVKITPREIDIIAFMSSGRSGKKIAAFFSISPKTIETHTRNIMEKFGCHSREGIIDFIEKAGKISILKEYYLKSLTHEEFEKSLKKLSLYKNGSSCRIVYWEDRDFENSLVHHLANHLKAAGVSTTLKPIKNNHVYSQSILKPSHEDYVIYVIPSIGVEGVSLEPQDVDEHSSHLLQNKIFPYGVLFLSFGDETLRELAREFTTLNFIDITKQQNYFYLVFEILKRILPASSIFETVFEEFKRKEEVLNNFAAPLPTQLYERTGKAKNYPHFKVIYFLKNRWRLVLASLLISSIGISLVGFLSFKFYFDKGQKRQHQTLPLSVCADFMLPPKALLLERHKILTQIGNVLKGQEAIHAVFLVGIGGSGKTTLARLYAQQQKYPVVWEINAESRESLINSFETLAFFLSPTEKEKKLLKGFKEIKKLEEREDSIISFVGEKLGGASRWLLIYDNVEDFNVVWKYFPQKLKMARNGEIIISTRDSNMSTNKFISHTIPVDELTPDEKLELFVKIMSSNSKTAFSENQRKDVVEFLKFLPPFPLDVSTAAYYLKATSTSYKNYLEHLQKPNEAFTNIQESVLGESSDYAKSRYQIITLSLKRLIETDKDFGNLLLFVSLLDSTHIPRDLLDRFKNDIIVDKFIFSLKKYSLISGQMSPLLLSLATFSMHRSTQAISLSYLMKICPVKNNQQVVNDIADTLTNYIGNIVETEDIERMKILIPHCETLRSQHKSFIIPKSLTSVLGCMYLYLGKYKEAKNLLLESLHGLSSQEKETSLWSIRALTYLGAVHVSLGDYGAAKSALEQAVAAYHNHFFKSYAGYAQALRYLATVYRDTGDYETAKMLFEKSLRIYQNHLPHHYVGIGRALGYVGDIYRELGKFEEARAILEQSFEIHKKYFPENPLGILWNFAPLGDVYVILGEYAKAQELLERGLKICKEYLPENHAYLPWLLGCLGLAHSKLGHYEDAKIFLENSASLFKNNFGKTHVYYAWAIRCLGAVYGELKDYDRAINLLQESLEISEKSFGKDHLEVALILRSLARIYLLQDKLITAQDLINRSYTILEKNKHPEIYVSLETLADIYMKKSLDAANKGDNQHSQKLREQAITTLYQALKAVKTNFGANSPFMTTIQSKISKLAQR